MSDMTMWKSHASCHPPNKENVQPPWGCKHNPPSTGLGGVGQWAASNKQPPKPSTAACVSRRRAPLSDLTSLYVQPVTSASKYRSFQQCSLQHKEATAALVFDSSTRTLAGVQGTITTARHPEQVDQGLCLTSLNQQRFTAKGLSLSSSRLAAIR